MKILAMFFFFVPLSIFSQNAWVNEFHYDNSGSPDIGEFVEVAIENSNNFNLDDFRISFYSSSSGLRYGIYHALSTFDVGSTDNNISLYSKFISGIQNGPNDGIALDYQGSVLHFISYEGILTGSEGVASGVTSVDVGVSESNSTPIGSSIGFSGSGINASSFSWIILSDDSPGTANSSQTLPVELITFSANVDAQKVTLSWETATEINNFGFEIERKKAVYGKQVNIWETLGFVTGHGNSNSPKLYFYQDDITNKSGTYKYRLKQIDIDGKCEYSNTIEVDIKIPGIFELLQNFPNPFNPSTIISFYLPYDDFVELKIFNILGENIKEIIHGKMSAGIHQVEFNGEKFESGIYFYELISSDYVKVKKMILLR